MSFYEEMVAKLVEEKRRQDELKREESEREEQLNEKTVAYGNEMMQKFLANVSLCFSDSHELVDEMFKFDLVDGNPRMSIHFNGWVKGKEKPYLNQTLLKQILLANNIEFTEYRAFGFMEADDKFILVFDPEMKQKQGSQCLNDANIKIKC